MRHGSIPAPSWKAFRASRVTASVSSLGEEITSMSDERETLELDVVFVGAGPASLAGACHLARLAKQNGLELSIGVLEKGREITSHAISGAVVDPRALKELFPDDWKSAPFEGEIEGEKVLWMTREEGALHPRPAADEQPRQLRRLPRQAPQVDGPEGRGRGGGHLLRVPRRPGPGRGRPGGRRPHRRQGDLPHGREEGQLRAGRRHPRPGHGARRRGRAAPWSSSSPSRSSSGRGRTRRSTPSA